MAQVPGRASPRVAPWPHYNARMYVVIMAGGGGTRLRPLSTAARPKPFLPLLPTGETLLQRTIARLRGPELDLGDGAICVVASAAYAPLVREQAPGVPVVVEPEGRNTAAAIALAALAVDRDDDDVMVVLPADHRIDPDARGRLPRPCSGRPRTAWRPGRSASSRRS